MSLHQTINSIRKEKNPVLSPEAQSQSQAKALSIFLMNEKMRELRLAQGKDMGTYVYV